MKVDETLKTAAEKGRGMRALTVITHPASDLPGVCVARCLELDLVTQGRGAAAALRALGLETGLTHMEWFRRADGSPIVSEVGARPPGAIAAGFWVASAQRGLASRATDARRIANGSSDQSSGSWRPIASRTAGSLSSNTSRRTTSWLSVRPPCSSSRGWVRTC